jgi:hypothetical protein
MTVSSFMTKKSVMIGIGAFCGAAALALGLGLGLGLKPPKKHLPECKYEEHLEMLKVTVPFKGGQYYNESEFVEHLLHSGPKVYEAMLRESRGEHAEGPDNHGAAHAEAAPEHHGEAEGEKHPNFEYVNPLSHYISCIDARNAESTIGTPGGEFSEFVNGLALHLEDLQMDTSSLNVKLQEKIEEKLKSYIDGQLTTLNDEKQIVSRPFFFHTAADKVNPALKNLGMTAFPTQKPANFSQFLNVMTNVSAQGCGHVRYMMTDPKDYKVPYAVVQGALRSLFTLYFDDQYKDKILIHNYQFSLRGRGVLLVKHHSYNASDRCSKREPLIAPTILAEKINQDGAFIYHEGFATQFRGNNIASFFDLYTQDVNERAELHFELTAEHIAAALPIAELVIFKEGEKKEEAAAEGGAGGASGEGEAPAAEGGGGGEAH